MSYMKMVFVSVFFVFLSGCASVDCEPDKTRTGYALNGTSTVVVSISLDDKGVPKENFKDIVVYPGQKVLFAGPDEFKIVFKNKKTPNGQINNKSSRGVVIIKIPEGILEQREYIDEFRKNNQLVFDYAIWVNGIELDPPMIVRRGD